MSREKDEKGIVLGQSLREDEVLDTTLRPKKWSDFIGQKNIKKNLKIIIEAARKRNEPACEHLLFYGNSGLGKTTLSHLVASEMEANLKVAAGPAIEGVGDLAAILTNLEEGDILFLDECHGLKRNIEEFLYPAMEDRKLHLILGKGPMAKTMDIDLPKFTLIGATTKIASLSSPLRNRFGATFQLDFYQPEEIAQIISNSARVLNLAIEPKAAFTIAKRSRFTPRVANRLLKRVRDWAQVEADGRINERIANYALNYLGIDELGLEQSDIRILKTIIEKFNGGPTGLQAIAAASFEEKEAILDIYEPYLMRLGFIERTPQGRTATRLAYKHLGFKRKNQEKLI